MSWQPPRRAPGSLAISLVLHVAIAIGLARVLSSPFALGRMFDRAPKNLPVERISFLALPRTAATVTQSGRAGGNGRPVTPQRPTPTVVAPTEVPSTIPPITPGSSAPSEPGTGEIIGGGGTTIGIRPSFSDPRLWVTPSPVVSAPKSITARLDSALQSRIQQVTDSLAVVASHGPKRAPGDWTVTTKNGDKWGMDGSAIRLGKVFIPNALLAALPLNQRINGGNPVMYERDKALAHMRSEILIQAQRSMNEEDFRDAVRRLRERKERERSARPELTSGEH